MKIAIVTSSFYPVIDGVAVAVFNRLKYLSKLGHQAMVFCPDYSALAEIYPNWQDYRGEILPGITVVSLPSKPALGLDFERDVTRKSYSLVVAELNSFQPDLIHIDEAERLTCCFLSKPGIEYARQHNIPCVAFFHTNYLEYLDDYFQLPWQLNQGLKAFLSQLFTSIYNSYDLTLVSSRLTYSKLTTQGINNLCCSELLGIDKKQYQQVQPTGNFWQQKYHLAGLESKIKLIFVGRLTPDKGWDFFFQAIKQLAPETLTNLALIVVGEGDYRSKIATELDSLSYQVYFLGRVDPAEIPQLLVNSDILVSNSEKETRGLAIIEAGAAGIPVIAPRAGGIIDTVVDGENGLLYQPKQPADFIAKLKLLVSVPELRQAMGTKAQAKVQQLDWQQTTDNLVRIWQQQIAQR